MIDIIAKDNDIIPYRKELNAITGGITATILLQQIIYRFVNNKNKPFYKFIEPCSHEKYTTGDSWCEELGFTRKEFLTAIKKLEDAGLVSKKTNMQRLTYYTLNLGDLDKALKGIYVNAERGFIKMPKGDLDNKETENTTENTTDIKEKNKKENLFENLIAENEHYDIYEDIANDFISYRKQIKKPLKTTGPLKAFIDALVELSRLGYGFEHCIEQMKSNEWQTVKVDYIHKPAKAQSNFTQPKSKVQKTNEFIDDFFERMAGQQQANEIIDTEILS